MASIWPKRRCCSERPKSSESFSFDELLDDARAGEREQRAGLRDQDVAERREARHRAAGRRVGEDAEERQPRLVQLVDRGDGLRELHQREDPLLHPGAAGARDEQQRPAAAIAESQARTNFSPTALPIEPPMNAKSMTASSSGWPSSVPAPTTIASLSPCSARPPRAARGRGAGRRSRAGRPSGRRPPPRRTSRGRRATRCATATASGSGTRSGRRPRARPRARRRGSASRSSGTCSGACSPAGAVSMCSTRTSILVSVIASGC